MAQEHHYSANFFLSMNEQQRYDWVLARCSDKEKGRAMLARYPDPPFVPQPDGWDDDEFDWDEGGEDDVEWDVTDEDEVLWDDLPT